MFVLFLITEDRSLLRNKKNPEDIQRRSRSFANDLENIPFHTAIFWAAFVVQCFADLNDKGKTETVALTFLFVLYCGFRTLFTICYAYAVQPFRSLFFVFAGLTVDAAAIIMVISAFNLDTAKFLP